MEITNRATEVDPLSRIEDGAQTVIEPAPVESKKKSYGTVLGLAKLSHWRTAAFFLSLFLCLTIVFAFSFIIPCPVRPQYLSTWNRTFPQAATYNFLAVEDASKDKVMDVLFAYKDSQGTQNITCTDEGLPSPCVFVTAVDGTDGDTLWERSLAPEFQWGQCGLNGNSDRDWDCLVSHSDQLTAVDKYTGVVKWQRPQPLRLISSLPVLGIPDLDGDKVSEVAVVATGPMETQLVIFSGKTGDQIGSEVVLDTAGTFTHLLHTTAKGSQYVLIQRESGLYGLALWKICAKAKPGVGAGLKKDQLWETKADPTSGLVTVYESPSLRYVQRTAKTGSTSNLLLATGEGVVLIDGGSLQPLWRVNTSTVLSKPSFGHYNDDGIPDIVIEENAGNSTKRVLILDGKSGGVLWEVNMLASPNCPRPSSVNTINSFSVFMLWGQMATEANSSVPSNEDRRSYMLHPHHSKVLLESDNVIDHILAFKATLLERGRHACYILLTGPQDEGAQGTVVIRKRKLKQDVTDSKVLRMGTASMSETNEDIKEAFNRLRFSEE